MEDFDKALLDIGWKNLDSEYRRIKDLDTKATGIITITGILIAFLIKPDETVGNPIIFKAALGSFFVTILISVAVIRNRKYEGNSTQKLINELENEDSERQIGGIIGRNAKTEQELCKIANYKAKELRWAIGFLALSILLLIIYSSNVL